MDDATWDDVAALLLASDAPLELLDADWQSPAPGACSKPAVHGAGVNSVGGEEESAAALGEQTRSTLGRDFRRRRYREKKKAERNELRAITNELAGKMVALERQARARGTVGMAAGWRGVALRQMQRRREAEALNRELRAMIFQRHGLALQLVEMLRTQATPSPSLRVAALLSAEDSKPVMELEDSDWRLIDTFSRELDGMYLRTEDVLRHADMPELAPGADHAIRHGRRWDQTTGAECGEITEIQAVPFAVDDAVYALYKSAPLMFGRECVPAIVALPNSAHSFSVKFQYRSPHNAAAVNNCVIVTKRVKEKTRWLLLWRALTTRRVATAAGVGVGASFLDEGWSTVRALASSAEGTVFESYSLSRLHQSPDGPDCGQLDEYMHELMAAAPSEAVELSQAMENALIDGMAALSVSGMTKMTNID